MRNLWAIILFFLLIIGARPVRARIFLRWTEPEIPSTKALGVKDLAVPWAAGNVRLMNTARDLGYRVFAEVGSADATAAANAVISNKLAGVIVEIKSENPGSKSARELVEGLRHAYHQLDILELDSQGKQPQIRGNLVVSKNGVLEVSSPTEQPWIDSNVALARFERAFRPNPSPLFSFFWDLIDPLERQVGPRAADYALAVAEAGAMRADVILPVHPNLQKALAEGNHNAWGEWEQVKTYIKFYSEGGSNAGEPFADIGVVADNYEEAYEAMNLMARHNIMFIVLRPSDVTAQRLAQLRIVIVFSRPDEQAIRTLQEFSLQGGTVVLVHLPGPFPWDVLPAAKTSSGKTYKLGRGRMVELSEPVGDPEAFAEVIRGLYNNQGASIYLWNALTTLAFAYREARAGKMELELVNYAQQPLRVQVRVRGSFSNIRYETPEQGNYSEIRPERNDGFTEFVVPSLRIGSRIYLSSPTEQAR